MDDTPTSPISGEDHHNQIPKRLALTDTSGQIHFGATANLTNGGKVIFWCLRMTAITSC
jgi:hypothetical protein